MGFFFNKGVFKGGGGWGEGVFFALVFLGGGYLFCQRGARETHQ